ncbi:uncharacterized protein [Cherax quadricarinatus]|uniref:uncharacterized protein n=1 Tax=Cherax quadricarinatus TaxID=27406 RepID=UPI00387EAE4A
MQSDNVGTTAGSVPPSQAVRDTTGSTESPSSEGDIDEPPVASARLEGGETPAAIHSGGSSGTCLMLLPLLLYLALCLASTCLISPSCCAMDSGVKVPRSIPGGEMDMGHNCAPSRHGMGVPPMTVMYVAARNQHFSQRKSTSLPGLSDAAVFCCHVRYYGCQLEKYSRRRLGGCSMA